MPDMRMHESGGIVFVPTKEEREVRELKKQLQEELNEVRSIKEDLLEHISKLKKVDE